MKAPLTLLALSLALPGLAAAQESRWSAGIGVIDSPSPYIGMDRQTNVIPVLGYEGENFYLRGPAAGYYLARDQKWSVSIGLQLAPSRLDTDESDDARIKRLDDRDFSVLGGLRARYGADWGALEAIVATDVSGKHHGQYAEVAYKYPISLLGKTLRLTPGLGINHYSADYADYYFGVSAAESVRSGFAQYQPGSTQNSFVELGALWQINANWQLVGSLRQIWLGSELKDSPIVEDDTTSSAYAGVVYRF